MYDVANAIANEYYGIYPPIHFECISMTLCNFELGTWQRLNGMCIVYVAAINSTYI